MIIDPTEQVNEMVCLHREVLVAMPGRMKFRPAAVHKEQQAEAAARYASIRRGDHSWSHSRWLAAQDGALHQPQNNAAK